MTKKPLYDVAIHEAGHAVMNCVFGVVPDELNIYQESRGGIRGNVHAGNVNLAPWQRIAVTYAGSVAEFLYHKNVLQTGRPVHWQTLLHRLPVSNSDQQKIDFIFQSEIPQPRAQSVFNQALRVVNDYLAYNGLLVISLADELIKVTEMDMHCFTRWLANEVKTNKLTEYRNG